MALGEILNETVGSWTDLFDLHSLINLLEALLEVDLYGRLVDDVLQGMYIFPFMAIWVMESQVRGHKISKVLAY